MGKEGKKKMRFYVFLAGLLTAVTLYATPLHAQSGSGWFERLAVIEKAIATLPPGKLNSVRADIAKIHAEAIAKSEQTDSEMEILERRLKVLGAPPEKDAPPEAPEIAAKRAEFTQSLRRLQAGKAESDLTLARIDELEASFSALKRERLLETLSERSPSPLFPTVVLQAIPDTVAFALAVGHAPVNWLENLPAEQKNFLTLAPLFLAGLLMLLVGWLAKIALLKRYGAKSEIENPPYARRLAAAMAEAIGRGLIPASILVAFLYWLTSPGALIQGMFAQLLGGLLVLFSFWALFFSFTRAVLSPENTEWRLTTLPPDQAKSIAKKANMLAIVVGLDYFLSSLETSFGASGSLMALFNGVTHLLEATAIIALTHTYLFIGSEETEEEEEAGLAIGDKLGALIRLIAMTAAGATLLGYAALGDYLITRLILSGLISVGVIFLRGLLIDLSQLARDNGYIKKLRKNKKTQQVFDSLKAAFDPLLVLLAILFILPVWGMPREELLHLVTKLLTGFKIGGVTISLLDITLAVAIFTGILLATKFIQRVMLKKLLSKTGMEESVQHSLSVGAGYIGVIIAATVAIAVMGIDLTNIAMVAGALSVGIGFGLQNIVNNFVSGIILLVERPVKVGDWVIVGGQEGFVKNINIRATELETFQRASIIIPNAEIISTPITNLTLKDSYGRIEVLVGVAYGSDTEQVTQILEECAANHPQVAKNQRIRVLFLGFGDSSLDFGLYCFTGKVINRKVIASDLRHEINKRFTAEGIEIPFPQRVVHTVTE